MTRKRYGSRRQRGAILVQSLLVVAALVALVATMAANERASLQVVQTTLRRRRIDQGTQSAIARALTVLAATNTNLVTLNDDWAQLGDNGDTSYDLGDGTTFRMQIVDTSSLVNINTVGATQLNELPLSQDEVAGLVDWRTAGETATANGAKDDVYNGFPIPYNARLAANIPTVSELLLINGWVASDLYSTQTTNQTTAGPLVDINGNPLPLIAILTADSGMPNTQASGTARTSVAGRLTAATLTRLGLTTALANTLVTASAQTPFTTWAALLRTPGLSTANAQSLLNAATVKTGTRLQGLINLNTATQSVLQTVPNISTDLATAIVSQQTTGLTSLGAMSSISGLNTVATMAQIADYVGVGSDTFVVRIYAESGGAGQAYEVLIGIRSTTTPTATGTTTTTGVSSTSNPVVLSYNKLTTPGIPAYWSWSATTTTTADAGAQQTTTGSTTTSTTSGGGATGGKAQ